jgi:hypothetical protein
MLITNNHNLPTVFINAVTKKSYPPKANRVSVSDLISPPQMIALKRKHYAELSMDASDMLWMLLGDAMHTILENASPENALSEEKLVVKRGDIEIVGKPDLLHNHEISDYKITSVYSFLLGEKPEWTQQLNLYKWLYEKKGFKVAKLTIHALLRDWTMSKTFKDTNYPVIPFMTVNIPITETLEIEQFIDKTIADLQAETPRPCTPEEQWSRPHVYALMKEGRKSAIKLYETSQQAYDALGICSKKDNCFVQERPGQKVRCESYCMVRSFCDQKKAEATNDPLN